MNQTLKTTIEETFQNEFDDKRFRHFVVELFNDFDFSVQQNLNRQMTQQEQEHIKNFDFLGSFKDSKDQSIDVLCVELQKGYKIERARHFQRNIIGKYLKSNINVNTALVAFYSKDDSTWRLSFVEIERKLEEGKIKTVLETPAKRYSFLVGKGESTHTAQKQLLEVLSVEKNVLVETIKKAFSIEKVTKEFYIEIAKLFTELVGGERKIGSKKFSSEGLLKYPGNNEIDKKEFAVRLIGRILFCWFLKKKRSKDGLALLTDDILSSGSILLTSGYYHNTLEPLFFEVLNTPIDDRIKDYKTDYWLKVPFLNGGLFEPHRKDFYAVDKNTNKSKYINTLKIPDKWLLKMLKLFEEYNFTIDESASIDIDLAIDPEMLGRVFENLLAEINPETGETARKQTGSFYTPRPIVEYMVDESLIAYLLQGSGVRGLGSGVSVQEEEERSREMEVKLRKLISYSDEEHTLSDEEADAIIDALDKAKILDPACGSGAFPMGMLQKIQLILQKLDTTGEKWLAKVLDDIKDRNARKMMERKLKGEVELLDFTRKLGIIQKSIYGVDIQEIAIEISKLRCFLSIVVDEKINDKEPNRGIQPLPNLEFKFVAANTLIGLPKVDFGSQLFNMDDKIAKLKDCREDYFQSFGKGKVTAEEKFIETQKEIALAVIKDKNLDKEMRDLGTALGNWNPFTNESSGWFDPEWMYGIKDGFDIVIGNPPYVQLQKDGGNLAKQFEQLKFETFAKTGDIYALFYEKGINLLKSMGHLTFITSNKWMRAGYGEKLREFFSKFDAKILIDLGPGVFESATVDTNILLIRKNNNSNNLRAVTINANSKGNIDINYILKNDGIIINKLTKDAWTISADIEMKIKEKIERIGTPLKDWDIKINYGIKTGFNKAFIIDGKKKDELIAEDPKSAEIIKPILRGRDIKRYKAEFADLWIINSHNGIKEKHIPRIDVVKNYPAIYKHLKQYKKELIKRQDKGDHWTNLRNCAYLEEFEKEKIVYQELTQGSRFAFDKNIKYFVSNTAYILTGNSLKYLFAFLNSKFAETSFSKYYSTSLGEGSIRWLNQYMEQFPVPKISSKEQKPFVNLVDKIIAKKERNKDTTVEEAEIDRMVYELYGLTEKEIAIVEGRKK